MAQATIESVQSDIGKRIGKKFGYKHKSLPWLLETLHGKLPAGIEQDLHYLFDAQERIKHPKRRGQVDMNRVEAIRRSCLVKLDGVDIERDKTRSRALLLAEFAARLLLFAAGLIGLLYWLDLI
ncbi:MAG: hypothetical protein IME92_00745 [Proteobacteria bacterium]|nr:hypothetical protein [Pseudomonadota bacterium]